MLTSAAPTTNLPAINYMFVLLMFYVFGIIGWFVPYVLLSLILLIWSFRSRVQTLIKVLALSPVVMAILIMVFVVTVRSAGQDLAKVAANLAPGGEDFIGLPVWFALMTLFWGYLCIGYGIYKLLQRRHIIRDEDSIVVAIGSA